MTTGKKSGTAIDRESLQEGIQMLLNLISATFVHTRKKEKLRKLTDAARIRRL